MTKEDWIGVGICMSIGSLHRNIAGANISHAVLELLCGAGIDVDELNYLKNNLLEDDYEICKSYLLGMENEK